MTFDTTITPPQSLLEQAKWAFVTRRVRRTDGVAFRDDFGAVMPGDLILGRVQRIGQHRGIQLVTGRRSDLFCGDLVVLAAAARYAPDQFEGVARIDPRGADLLASGGCLGQMRDRNFRTRLPTCVYPLGRVMRADGKPVNLGDYALPPNSSETDIPVIGVIGTAMNSGKTLATARLGYGLRQAGRKVALIKVTGTGAFGDYNEYVDTGASYVADFTDAGLASTYMQPLARIKDAFDRLLSEAVRRRCDVAVMEIADGIFQRETAALLNDSSFTKRLAGLIFACGDAVSAAGGAMELRRLDISPLALTGLVSCSPMASREAKGQTGLRIVTKEDLADPAQAMGLLREATGAGWKNVA